MKPSYLTKLFVLAFTTLVLSACSGSSGGGGKEKGDSDTTAPIITLNGSKNISLFTGETYTELHATATDNIDGVLPVTTTGTVKANDTGFYTITYQAIDNSGNETISWRTIVVSEVILPNDTVVTWGGNSINCTNELITCSNQEAPLSSAGDLTTIGNGMAGFNFVKLDAYGDSLANQTQDYATQPWSCVKDTYTGLIWEIKTPDTQKTNLHSMNDSFNWYNTNLATNSGAVGFDNDDGNVCTGYDSLDATTFCNTQAFVSRVNAAGLCGATDWRLPNLNELQSIVHLNKSNPAIDENYFPNSGSNWHWSSSPSSSSSNFAWGIHFDNGNDGSNYRDISIQVRLVRGQ